MKKSTVYSFTIGLTLSIGLVIFFNSIIISNPKSEDCQIVEVTITKIAEGSSSDIVFHTHPTNFYYINRGLEQGLNLDSLKTKVLNKTVTLHLANILGSTVSNHISQMTIERDTIFSEF